MTTDAALLVEVEAAISAILRGVQSYTISTPDGSRSYQYANLDSLKRMRDDLKAGAAREAAGGVRVRGITPA